ncbi:hypothetical protein [Sagittula salina]|uniref:Uncharacterized protein n=1 Tax=Sagittula salina TaxID=2820268 RepID=A0A940MR92_9RHOB|nr:hypothetical protein [Sagittula salina]MBP0482592.1 hypothetical protein [Sagittula salina]
MDAEDHLADSAADAFGLDSLTEIAWHDAWLLEIYIDRTEPGHRDVVRLVVEWSDEQPRPSEPVTIVEFLECYGLEMEMNFGVIAAEAIDRLWLEPAHPKLAKIAQDFGVDDVTCVCLRLGSTDSTIRIFARAVAMMPDTSFVTLH